jgi:hypothetical protein
MNRKYWIDYIKRLVKRDYRPEPTLDEDIIPSISKKNDSPDDQDNNESKDFSIFYNKLSIPKIKPGKTFRERLFEFIDNRSMDEVKLYQQLGISRSIFSKIRSNDKYQPDRDNAFRFSIGLRLNLDETIEFIGSAGFNFKVSSERDLVIKHCIENHIYELMLVDEILVGCGVEAMFSKK